MAASDSERFARAIVNTFSEQICVLDKIGTMLIINGAWRDHARASPLIPANAAEGTNYLRWCEAITGPSAQDARAFAVGIRAVLSGKRDEFLLHYSSQTPTGQRWFIGRATCFPGDGPRLLVVAHEDISERIWVEQALREAIDVAEAAQQEAETAEREEEQRRQEADRRRQIAEGLRDILTLLNSNRPLDEVLNYIVSQARRLLGSQAAAIYAAEPGTGEVIVRAARGLSSYYLSGARRGGQHPTKPIFLTPWPVSIPDIATVDPGLNDPGLEVQDLMLLAPPADEYRALLAVPILIKDEIYGRLRLYYRAPREFSEEDAELVVLFSEQAALAIENARLREQVRQAAIIDERSRLARDLHDAVTQTIFSASLIAEALPRIWERRPEEGLRGLQELHHLIQGALAEMRTLLLELRPTAITEKKLGELLKQLTDTVASQAQIAITFTVESDRILPASVQIAFYRVAQEALNNSIKHARASQIVVELQGQGEEVIMRISDNGCGFDPGAIRPDQLGVNIMRERAQSVGATFTLTSQPGLGTQILVTWFLFAGRVKA